MKAFNDRVNTVFEEYRLNNQKSTDQVFALVLTFQALLGMFFAIIYSPLAWSGDQSQIHIHIYAAIFIGGLAAGYPIFCIWKNPESPANPFIVTVAQMTFSMLYVHLTGGRIETHFHIFGSLAFLAFYKNWRVILLATLITTIDHFLRGYFWPMSIYGVLTASPWRAMEHSGWVVFEDAVLLLSIRAGVASLRAIAEKQVQLELTVASIEDQVSQRTRELQLSQKTILEQQHSLAATSKMSALGEMAGGIAHEINNPLASVKLLSGQIVDISEETDFQPNLIRELAQKIEKVTDRISKIVLGLRSFSRDGSNDETAEVKVSTLIEDTLSFCQERFRGKGVILSVEPFNPELSVKVRATEMSQVLLNLLNNSFDAIQNRGDSDKWIKISASESVDSSEIRVVDSGCGIPDVVREKLFQPFFTTKEIGKGTGIGLSISAGIVRSHHGQLRLDNSCKNTCFVISLPRKAA